MGLMRPSLVRLSACALAVAATAYAQGRGGQETGFPSAAQFATPQAQKHVAAAMALARTDLVAEARAFCTPTGPQRAALAREAAGLPPEPDYALEPTRVFENLAYVGFNDVGAWVISTSGGLILIDSLNNEAEARDVLVPGIRKLGLDPAQIKYVIMGHGHNDHTGGGVYLQNTYGARIVMGAPDWDAMANATGRAANRPRMKRDMDVADGQKITVGDTTVTLALTPGHTPGTIAMLVPVKHRGRTHTVMIMSGTQMPTRQSLATFEHVFDDFARKQDAEAALGSHPGTLVNTLPAMDALRRAYPAGPHPFLYGPERFGRYLSILVECGRARLAALGTS